MASTNEIRKLRIKDSNFEYLDEGSYAVIFVDTHQKRIRKLFKANAGTRELCKEIFDCEVKAYRLIYNTPSIQDLVPENLIITPNQRVEDKFGTDVTDEFYSDLSFEAEYIAGSFEKPVMATEWAEVRDLFQKVQPIFTGDVSVLRKEGRIIKVVDVSTREFERFHQD